MMSKRCWLIAALVLASALGPAASAQSGKKAVLIAGPKSHGPGDHEYVKTVRLLAALLDETADAHGVRAEVVLDGWPAEEAVFDDADVVMVVSDGGDGPGQAPAPFMTPERMRVLDRHIARGMGFMTFHFSTFAPDTLAPEMLEWTGGYFDWQDDTGARNWYSDIRTVDTTVVLADPAHPVARGLPPTFRFRDEFYFDMRFRDSDPRLRPILSVPSLPTDRPLGDVVAWAVERADGGRGFGTTTGHFFDNWRDPNYRKLILNAIVWTAGAEVPEGGVEAPFRDDRAVGERLFGTPHKALILTGNNHPAHDWPATTAVLRRILGRDGRLHVDVTTDIHDLGEYTLADYDVLALNYANWEDPSGLGDRATAAFEAYLDGGGGLLVVHFANGAFHYSLPEAGASDWPGYRRIVRRVWDHDGGSAHDNYGRFRVNVTDVRHPVTDGLTDFETTDELYYNQAGDAPITPLLTARSRDTGRDEPLAWAYRYGAGRVFQTVLGHDVASLETPAVQRLLHRAALWAAGLPLP